MFFIGLGDIIDVYMPTYFIFIPVFILGTIIGSFLNVVIYRFNTGRSVSTGRSICMSCNKTLRWFELVPVLSYVMQSGRCRRCCSIISYQYPLVELSTGIIFGLLSLHFRNLLLLSQSLYVCVLVVYMFIFSLLIVITGYDIKHKIIPDVLVYTYALVSFLSIYVNSSGVGNLFIHPSWLDVASGFILALPFALIWLISRGRAMGLGDAKLILGIGFMLGLSRGVSAVMLSFWIGSVVGIIALLLHHKKISMKTEIPFAPFLVIGTLIAFFCNIGITQLVSLFTIN